jgi:hypothetical protein
VVVGAATDGAADVVVRLGAFLFDFFGPTLANFALPLAAFAFKTSAPPIAATVTRAAKAAPASVRFQGLRFTEALQFIQRTLRPRTTLRGSRPERRLSHP